VAALKDYFLAGAGLDNFSVIYNNYAAHATQFAGLNRPAHNVFLQIAVESGAIGLLLFVFVIGSHLKYALRRDSVSTGAVRFRLIACEAATCGILVASFFLGLLWTKTFWITWTLLAICTRVPRMDLLPVRPLSHEVANDFEPSQSPEVLVSSQA
jgi:O-antigen ligase